MEYRRYISKKIISQLKGRKKIVAIYGARQVGKTCLVNDVISKLNLKTLEINTDRRKYIDVLSSRDIDKLKSLVDGYDLLFIDEAQRIPDIGINLKILHEELKNLRVIVTGSSSFDLSNKIAEPLTGCISVFNLMPFSINELKSKFTSFELNEKLEDFLIYGNYPEVFTTINHDEKQNILIEIGSSYLYKDIIELADIRYINKLHDLLRLIAFRIGSVVSINELSQNLNLSRDAVARYISVLEKTFIIFRLSGFSRNLQKEISKIDKFFFFDMGIRNMIINNFNPLNNRNDIGQLWENFILSERMKKLSYEQIHTSRYFWRTYTGAELDYVEENDGLLRGYEIKYKKVKEKAPQTWVDTYSNSEYHLINKNNFLEFII